MNNLLAIGTLYTVPKVLTLLSKKPSEEAANELFYQARAQISEFLEATSNSLGNRGRFLCCEVLGDNAWISAFVLDLLKKNRDLEATPLATLGTFFCGSFLVWMARYGLASCTSSVNPSIARLIAPRRFQTEEPLLVQDAIELTTYQNPEPPKNGQSVRNLTLQLVSKHKENKETTALLTKENNS